MPKIINLFEELEYCYTYSNFLDKDGLVFRKSMAKYPKKAQVIIKENLHAMKQGRLEIGSGHTVTNPKQALSALVYPKSEKGVLRYLRIKNKIVFIPNEK